MNFINGLILVLFLFILIEPVFTGKVLSNMSTSPEIVPDQTLQQERGFSLENDFSNVAHELYRMSDNLYEINSDVLVNNPTYLGNAYRKIDKREQTFFADFRRQPISQRENCYEWLVSDGGWQKRLVYVSTNGININGAVEERDPNRPERIMRILNSGELLEAPRIIQKVLDGIGFRGWADVYREKRKELRMKLTEFALNPTVTKTKNLYRREGGLVKVETEHTTYKPDDKEYAMIYDKKEQEIEKMGFPKTALGNRFDEFAGFVAQQTGR
jgi:hypothetical protein